MSHHDFPEVYSSQKENKLVHNNSDDVVALQKQTTVVAGGNREGLCETKKAETLLHF